MLDGLVEFYEPLATLAYLAAGDDVACGSACSVYVLPYRNPVVTAKLVATLDALSGGRVHLRRRRRLAARGVHRRRRPTRARGRVTDEYLEVCRRLWRDDVAEFAGDHYQLPAVRAGPKPAQRRRGRRSGSAATPPPRAGAPLRLGDGLHLIDCRPDEIPACPDGAAQRPDRRRPRAGRVHAEPAAIAHDRRRHPARRRGRLCAPRARLPRPSARARAACPVDALAVRIADLAETLLH